MLSPLFVHMSPSVPPVPQNSQVHYGKHQSDFGKCSKDKSPADPLLFGSCLPKAAPPVSVFRACQRTVSSP